VPRRHEHVRVHQDNDITSGVKHSEIASLAGRKGRIIALSSNVTKRGRLGPKCMDDASRGIRRAIVYDDDLELNSRRESLRHAVSKRTL
jgi:hypothetical protein